MNESDARLALRELGIIPTRQLVENWLRANTADDYEMEGRVGESEPAPVAAPEQTRAAEVAGRPVTVHSSKSRLEPILREQGTLERPPGRRKPGRPRIIASWFEKVAERMADGTSLKTALAMNGLKLSKSEVRACHRNRTLRTLYTESRRLYLAEHYGRKPTLRAVIGRYL